MLEVVAVPADWLPLLDVQRTLRVTHRGKPTREAKTTTAEMPTAGLGVGVPTADAASEALDSGDREPPLARRELAGGREPDPHRLRTGEQCGAEQPGVDADQAQRQGRDGAGGTATAAERDRGACGWPAPRNRERLGGKGGSLPARLRRRDRIRPTMQLIQKGPWGVLNPSESRRVEERHTCRGCGELQFAGGFRHRSSAAFPTLTTFPLPAHRTERAVFQHWALVRDHAFAHAKLAVCTFRRVSPMACHGRSFG